MRRAIFFDRDGTLLVEVGYLNHPSLVVPYRFTIEALRLARDHGFLLIVVSNQSGVARGYITESDLRAIHDRMQDRLGAGGAAVDAVYYCPHHPEAAIPAYRKVCSCRKPGPAMGLEAAQELDIDLGGSFVIGDKETDLLFGTAIGAPACLVRTGFGSYEETGMGEAGLAAFAVRDNVLEAVRWVLERERGGHA